MKKIWVGSQVVLNNIEHSLLKRDDLLKRKLSLAKEKLNLNTLLIWPDRENKNLELVQNICSDFRIKTFLWYPLLADIALFRIRPQDAVETFEGSQGYGKIGRWQQLGQGEEDFLFLCPNNEREIDRIFQYFQKQTVEDGYDGVFLDRIRFPSPVSGLEPLFTCFCPWCQDKFYKYYQEDLNIIRPLIKKHIQKLKTMELNDFADYHSFSDILKTDNLRKFFNFRSESIYQLVKRFADEAKRNHKEVGLDLFAPSLAPLVAQNYELLAETADWLKPMFYCHTAAPAGLPLELTCFLSALLGINQNLKEKQLINEISRILKVELPSSINSLLQDGVTEEIILREAEKLKSFNLPEETKIYLGLEAVQIEGLVRIDSDILKRYLGSVLETDLDGIILSWNILQIPDGNLKTVGDFL